MPVRFHEELFGESLEEAGALFIQRCQDLDPPQSGLHQVLEVDARIEAHLDLLFAGGSDAVATVAATASESAGGSYTGARALLRQGQVQAWSGLAQAALATPDDPDRLANGEPMRLGALKAASAHEAWVGDLHDAQRLLAAGGDSPLTTCLAYAAGYQRWDAAPALQTGLTAGVAEPATWLWALGQIGEAQARDTLIAFLEDANPNVCGAAALALCRTEEDQMAAWLVSQALNQLWAPMVLAFLGGPRAQQVLTKHVQTGDVFAVTATGLLGDGASVDVLLAALSNADQAAASAQALHLTTGLAPLEQTQAPAAATNDADEPPFVDTSDPVWRLTQSPTRWAEALQRSSLSFLPATRYRLGRPADPAQSLLALRSPHVRQELRTLLIDELFIRFGLGVHLRADQHAGRQLRVLDKLEQFLPHMATKPVPGHFTFQGRRGVGP